MQQPSNIVMGVTAVVALLLALYLIRSITTVKEIATDETSVSLCQVHVQFDELNTFNDRTVLLLLSVLKKYDFRISQPVWGPPANLLYLCEHQLKTGLKQVIIDKELNNILKTSGKSSKHLAWSCA